MRINRVGGFVTYFSVPLFQSDLCWLEDLTMLLTYKMAVMILEMAFFLQLHLQLVVLQGIFSVM